MTDLDLNQESVDRLLSVIDAGLVSGMGQSKPGEMCVEAAVCYWLGLPHSDNPSCVGPAVRAFKIRLNDSKWSSPQARGLGLRRLAVAQLGSDEIDQGEFSKRVVLKTIQIILPKVLRLLSLEANAIKCEQASTLGAAATTATAARAATRATAARAAAARAADVILSMSAELAVAVLGELSSPGYAWIPALVS